MIVSVVLEEDLLAVIKRMADTFDVPVHAAVTIALRDWAIGEGFLPPDELDLDEDTPTEGSA